MVTEIASESDPRLDSREKLPRYRQAGIEEIWLVNPSCSSVVTSFYEEQITQAVNL